MKPPLLSDIQHRLRSLASSETACVLQGFFKTGPGQYGAGDMFLGIKVPTIRSVAREFPNIGQGAALELLHSPFHEERLLALLFLIRSFSNGGENVRLEIFNAYLANTAWINNWDLVDLSAPHVAGAYLAERPRSQLYRLVRSPSLWDRRIAMVATLYFIRRDDFADTLQLASLLLNDREDLMHKATGWMLREVGKRDQEQLEIFLREHGNAMPRTMLRYAIERLPETLRQAYLRK